MAGIIDIQHYKREILKGNIVLLAQAITLVESKAQKHKKLAQELLHEILPYTGNSWRIGITGVPGSGKSTFINSFGQMAISKGKKIAVLAVDPSSSISKGSILGDKTRMEELTINENAFIRPSANRGHLGGVHQHTFEAILLCEAAGYDFIIVETVGVGQSEIMVHSITDFFLLLKVANTGDELQGIKKGILEMSDAILVNKADKNNLDTAKIAKIQLQKSLHLYPSKASEWIPKVLLCSSLEVSNFDNIWEMTQQYFTHTKANNFFFEKRKTQNASLFKDQLKDNILHHLLQNEAFKKQFESLNKQLEAQTITPFKALENILSKLKFEEGF